MANDMACELFGYSDAELIGVRLSTLLNNRHKDQGALQELDIDPETGCMVQISGRIVSGINGCLLTFSCGQRLLTQPFSVVGTWLLDQMQR